MSQLQQFSVSRKMKKKTAGPAKAQLMTARINFSISLTLIFVLVKMTYINARCWQLFPEPPCFCAAFPSLYRCDPLFPRPFRLSCVQWNAAEMRGINCISVSNKWFNSSTSEVRLLLQLWVRREITCWYTCRRYLKNPMQHFLVYILYIWIWDTQLTPHFPGGSLDRIQFPTIF